MDNEAVNVLTPQAAAWPHVSPVQGAATGSGSSTGAEAAAQPPDAPPDKTPACLQDIAIARSGDKGNRATLTVIARDLAHYPLLERLLTPERMRMHYHSVVQGEVHRYLLPHLGAVHFVLYDALGGGVTRSLALDAHGKTLSAAILSLPLNAA